MKKIKMILVAAVISFAGVRCTEDNNSDMEPEFPIGIAVIDTLPIASGIEEKITEEKKEETVNVQNSQKYIYLTIDDAPLNGSAYIDSIIKIEKVKTNLFVVGNPANGSKRFKKYYESLQKNPYIEIYNHSYSHGNHRYVNFYKKPEAVLADFEKNESELNISHKIARLPGRNLWMMGDRKKNVKQTGASSATLLQENGYDIFGWDVEWRYNPDGTPLQSIDELVEEIEKMSRSSIAFAPNQVVLLLHDQMFATITHENNLQELIQKLKERGFVFEYLSGYRI